MRNLSSGALRAALVPLLLMGITCECFIVDIVDFLIQRWRDKHSDQYDVYMDVHNIRKNFDEPFHKNVRQALEELPLGSLSDPTKPMPDAREILAVIKNAAGQETKSVFKLVYEQLMILADGRSNDCSVHLIEVIKSILFQCRAGKLSPKLVELMKHFLRQYGRRRMEFCVRSVDLEKIGPVGSKAHRVEQRLTNFFLAGKSVAHDETSLFRILDSIKLTTSKFDRVHSMANVAREKVGHKLGPARKQPLSIISAFLDQECGKLMTHFRTTFDIINLTRILGSPMNDYPVKLLRLNELNRLCLSWQKDSGRIYDNLYQQQNSVVAIVRPPPSDGQQ